MKGDSKEQIKRCLTCRKKTCNNCVDTRYIGVGINDVYLWDGEERKARDLAEERGLSFSAFRTRIAKGGLDFAMSQHKKIRDWEKEGKA